MSLISSFVSLSLTGPVACPSAARRESSKRRACIRRAIGDRGPSSGCAEARIACLRCGAAKHAKQPQIWRLVCLCLLVRGDCVFAARTPDRSAVQRGQQSDHPWHCPPVPAFRAGLGRLDVWYACCAAHQFPVSIALTLRSHYVAQFGTRLLAC